MACCFLCGYAGSPRRTIDQQVDGIIIVAITAPRLHHRISRDAAARRSANDLSQGHEKMVSVRMAPANVAHLQTNHRDHQQHRVSAWITITASRVRPLARAVRI